VKITYSSFSIQGRERQSQDCILEPLEGTSGSWCAIADGVGGRPDGDKASALAVDTVRSHAEAAEQISMQDVFSKVVDEFDKEGLGSDRPKAMATTLSVVQLSDSLARVGHVGDTRVYHLRNEGILRRTKDQTEVQDLLDRGVINKRQAARYQRKNVLTGYISSGKEPTVFETEFQIETGDRLILLTDGVYGVVTMREIRDISVATNTVSEFTEKLKAAVESAGVIDDYSALVVSIDLLN
jgi:serine/threonine protein phosphatase PrpC